MTTPPEPFPATPCPRGFTLPAVLLIATALLILAVGILSLIGIERQTARSYVDLQRADLAARSALEDIKGLLTAETANDSYLILQSARTAPVLSGREPTPNLFLARGQTTGGALSYRYLPLFSTTAAPENTSTLRAPEVEPLLGSEAHQYIDLATQPYLDPSRISWVFLEDEKNRAVARYAYWVEDLQGKLDPALVGNTKGSDGSHVRADAYPFPAPGLNPEPAEPGNAAEPTLDQVSLHALDPSSTADQEGELGKTLIQNRGLLLTPDSLLASAQITPPLQRDASGRLTDLKARAVEEHLSANVQSYREQPLVPYSPGLEPSVMGQPKLNLNALLAENAATAVDEMAAWIHRALPEFDNRKGGFPDDYAKTLAANAIDYADTDSEPTVGNGYRGLDAYPLMSEIILRIQYQGYSIRDTRKYLHFELRYFVEFWNMTNQPVSGDASVSYEVGLTVPALGSGVEGERFDDPSLLGSENTIHSLAEADGRHWTAPKAITLLPNQYSMQELAVVTYGIDIASASDPSVNNSTNFTLQEPEGSAGISFRWNGIEVERIERMIRDTASMLANNNTQTVGKAGIPGHSYGPYGSYVNNMGDPRISHYLRIWPLGPNSYPQNISPNRRNIRRGSIYDSDGSTKPLAYGRVLPSEWPDGGHDSLVGTWAVDTNANSLRFPTDNSYQFTNSIEGEAPQRISNRGKFYSATELGRLFDPVMWVPTYDNDASRADSTLIQRGVRPGGRFQWPSVVLGNDTVTADGGTHSDHGGGNTLRIGRPEHPGFDQPGKRASQLLDLFHTGIPRSEDVTLQEGPTVYREGQVNLNTASQEALQAILTGPISQDPELRRLVALNHNQMRPRISALELHTEAVAARVAQAVIHSRPFTSPSEAAHAKEADGTQVFGNPNLYPDFSGDDTPQIQWSDAAAEELFARLYEASTVRSRNFRVWVIGQSLTPTTSTNSSPEVLSEVRKVFTLFSDPGERPQRRHDRSRSRAHQSSP